MKVLIVGDLHGHFPSLERAIVYAENNDCERIVQVGDFGIWPEEAKLLKTMNPKIPVFFVDGNHEHFPLLRERRKDSLHGIVEVYPNIFHCSRGHVEKWSETTIMFLGGAFSIDRRSRKLGHSWFLQEEINDYDMETALANKEEINLMITHDAPFNLYTVDPYVYIGCIQNREKLQKVWDTFKPSFWFFGHYHIDLRVEKGECDFVCLNCAHDMCVNALIFDCQDKRVLWRGNMWDVRQARELFY